MAKFFQRRVRVLLGAAIAGFALWSAGEKTPWLQKVDAFGFQAMARTFANPPFFVSGDGSHAQPWALRMRPAAVTIAQAEAQKPVVVTVGEGSWEYYKQPSGQKDYQVIFRYLKAHGARHVAMGVMLEGEPGQHIHPFDLWLGAPPAPPATDPALPPAKQPAPLHSAGFPSLVTITSLDRRVTPEDIPTAFIRSSLPVELVHGDVSQLPVVNHVPVPGTVLGDLHTLAGFSELESAADSKVTPLLARWKDRIVFAFPVVAALAERDWPASGVEVRLGEYIKLAPDGPVIPIDASGNLLNAPPRLEKLYGVPAWTLMDEGTKLSGDSVMILPDVRRADEEAEPFHARSADLLAAIRADGFLTPVRQFPRPSQAVEACLLGALVFLLGLCAAPDLFRLRLGFGIVFASVLLVQLLAAAFGWWLPGLPFTGAVLAGFVASWPFERKPAREMTAEFSEPVFKAEPEPMPEPPVMEEAPSPPIDTPVAEIEEPSIVPAEPPPAKKAARKAAKKVAAKAVPRKAASEKIPAKKAAKKTARKTSDLPPPPAAESPAIPAKKAARKAAKKAPRKPPPEQP